MSDSELALFGSLSSIGALIGTPVVGFLLDRLGRKKCSLLFSLFGVVSIESYNTVPLIYNLIHLNFIIDLTAMISVILGIDSIK